MLLLWDVVWVRSVVDVTVRWSVVNRTEADGAKPDWTEAVFGSVIHWHTFGSVVELLGRRWWRTVISHVRRRWGSEGLT